MVNENPLIVALDTRTAEEAVEIAQTVSPHVGAFMIGSGLLYGPGPSLVDALYYLDRPVLVDAMLHGIPSQVEKSAERLAMHGARWVTANISGGSAMLLAAVKGVERGSSGAQVGVLGVSVLTSLGKDDLLRMGIDRTPGELVGKMAVLAEATGCEGIICSPLEANVARMKAQSLIRVTPGIRVPYGGESAEGIGEHKRSASPIEALEKGATMLVIGREITGADDPVFAAESIKNNISGYLENR